ncbi:hypothetical protein ACFPM0_03040 [Pseudonocardia sulfidoxydans]
MSHRDPTGRRCGRAVTRATGGRHGTGRGAGGNVRSMWPSGREPSC